MQTLTLGQLKDLRIQFTCTKWNRAIEYYLDNHQYEKDDFLVDIEKHSINLLLKEGTCEQKLAVEKLGIILSNPIEWDKIKTGSKVMLKNTGEICGEYDYANFNKPFDVVFFKTPHVIFYDNEFDKKSTYPLYCTFHQNKKFITFAADKNTDYITSVIEY